MNGHGGCASLRSLRRKWALARRLRPHDWLVILQAWCWLLLVDLALRILPFRRAYMLLARAPAEGRARRAPGQAGSPTSSVLELVDWQRSRGERPATSLRDTCTAPASRCRCRCASQSAGSGPVLPVNQFAKALGTPDLLLHTARLVDIARRLHLYPMTCLRRSLVLQRLLAGQGLPTELRIGVRREGERLLAHAWLEYGGQPVAEPPGATAQFAPLPVDFRGLTWT